MTEQYLYDKLNHILATIDKDVYPEIVSIIQYNTSPDGKVFEDAFEFAAQLHHADQVSLLPGEVAALIVEIYLEEIERGNVPAMTNLGALYYTGRGGEQNYEKALTYYLMADRCGEPQATENLGYCYYYGHTGTVDYEKAYHYFVKGALVDRLNSLYKIGDMYENGFFVDKDESLAFRIYQRCYHNMSEKDIERVGADICLRMGNSYYYGIGTEKNLDSALQYYQEAERYYYRKLRGGDFFAKKGLKDVIVRQNEIRAVLADTVPNFDWAD